MGRRKRYSAEFKREALRRAEEPVVTDALVAEELKQITGAVLSAEDLSRALH